ncbi:MAG: GGDEF domain-containing protein [Firmicutes bacterium]|nr:GGDEF domain-containing protein [Bacillota bacterium]
MYRIIDYVCRRYVNYEDIKVFKGTTFLYIIGISILLPHLFFMFYFTVVGLPFMTYVNLASCLVYFVVIALIRSGRQKAASMLITAEVALYSGVVAACFGPNVDAQDFIIPLILAQYLIFDLKQSERLNIAVLLCLVWYGAIYVGLVFDPPFSGREDWFLRRVNVFVALFFILFELILHMLVTQLEKTFYSRQISEIKEESYIDSLTGLKNRRFADKVYFRKVAEGGYGNVCFALLDIDGFKGINDSYGHDGGDFILRYLGEILTRNLRSTDLVCRWGGEEFLVVMAGCELQAAQLAMSKIKDAVSRADADYNGTPIAFTFTAGLCQYAGEPIVEIIKKCDEKLYEGKNSGKNVIIT